MNFRLTNHSSIVLTTFAFCIFFEFANVAAKVVAPATIQQQENSEEPTIGQKLFVLNEDGISANYVDVESDVNIPFGAVLNIEEVGPNRFTVRYQAKPVSVKQHDVFDSASAFDHINDQIEKKPTAEWYAAKTHVLYSQRKFKEAIEASDLALEIDGRHIKALQYRTTSYFFLQELNEVKLLVDQLLEIAPDHYLTYANQFYYLNTQGDLDAQIKAMEKSVELNPYSSPLWSNLGYAHWQVGAQDRSFECFEKAIEVSPGTSGGYQIYGICAYSIADFETAREYLEKAEQRNCLRSQTYETLATLVDGDSEPDHERYLQLIKKAAACDDCSVLSQRQFAWEMATSPNTERHDAEVALEIAERLIEAGQTEPEILAGCLEAKVAALARLNRFMEAQETLDQIDSEATRSPFFQPLQEAIEAEEAFSVPSEDFDL